MGASDRRRFLCLAGSGAALLAGRPLSAAQPHAFFVAEAERMKRQAVDAGDQPYGAVVVRNGAIVGYGASRVIADRNPDAHAERVALRDAQARLGTANLAGAVLYSTSRPCPACEAAAAAANLDRMLVGPDAADAGKPRPR
jgi:tRNA(Arg) A34 adenosine deaminase TadA